MPRTHNRTNTKRRLTLAAALCALASLAPGLASGSRAGTLPRPNPQTPAAAGATLNLSDFGAKGDGSTDDGPAFQAALDALAQAGGGSLFVPAGRYAILTPVVKNFSGLDASVTISGVVSDTAVPPPTADGDHLSRGLDLKSEILPRTGSAAAALRLYGLRSALLHDLAFVGTAGVQTDAAYTLVFGDVDDATVSHCEFYALSSYKYGSDVLALRSNFHVERSVFLGCTANSGAYTSVVQNLEWKGFTMEEAIFLDYGQRPGLFGKTGFGAPVSWVQLGNAAAVTNDSPRREAVFRSVFLDEGGLFGIASFPGRYLPASAPVDLVYVTGLNMNVSNLNAAGNNLQWARGVLVEDSDYGWSQHADAAITLSGVANAILDRVHTEADATRIRADSASGRLTVIDSVYDDLASLATLTVVLNTTQPDEDPVQHVRARFETALGREPDPAAHFYWSDKILRCGADAQCAAAALAALDAYLAASPDATFSITGRIADENDSPLAGATVALSGSQSVSATTDAAGLYHFSNLPTSGAYAVTVSKRHYTFAAPPQTFTTPAGDASADFDAVLQRHTLSGRVTDSAGRALAGATVALSGSQSATTTSDDAGNYSFAGLGGGGGYTVTPSKTHYTFAPASQAFADLSGDKTANFAATVKRHTISGRVAKQNNSPVGGVTVTLSGSQAATASTDSHGNFSFANLPAGGDYTVTPSLKNYTLSPASRAFTDLGSDQFAGFVTTLNTYTVRGRVTKSDGTALAGVTLTLSGTQTGTTTSDDSGSYSFRFLTGGGTFIVRPSKANYTFAPVSRSFGGLSSDQTADFTGALVSYRISGRVTANGAALGGVAVALTGSKSAAASTDANGAYSFVVPAEGSYAVTPSDARYTFTPASQTFDNLSGARTADFAATVKSFAVAERVSGAGDAFAGDSRPSPSQ